MTGHRLRLALACMLACAVLPIRSASAARLLQVYIEQDGNVVAHTYYEDGGRADAATVWRYLAQPPIMVDDEVTKLAAGSEDPLRAELSGKLVVRFQHANRVIASAQLSSLVLRRQDQQTQAWFLPEAEVERSAIVSGLGPPQPAGSETLLDGYLALLATCVIVLFGCIVVTFLLLRGPAAKTSE